MKARRPISKLKRRLYLSTATAFCFFLIASTPHRVHHLFEQLPGSSEQHTAHADTQEHTGDSQHGHGNHASDDDQRQQENNCIVLSVAQHAHGSLVQLFSFASFDVAFFHCHERPVLAVASFNPAPRSQRAPPPMV